MDHQLLWIVLSAARGLPPGHRLLPVVQGVVKERELRPALELLAKDPPRDVDCGGKVAPAVLHAAVVVGRGGNAEDQHWKEEAIREE